MRIALKDFTLLILRCAKFFNVELSEVIRKKKKKENFTSHNLIASTSMPLKMSFLCNEADQEV